MKIVGLGAQDSEDEAREFVEKYGTVSLQMLWDPTFASWQQLGIRGQPAFAVFDRHGVYQSGWYGEAAPGQILEAVSGL